VGTAARERRGATTTRGVSERRLDKEDEAREWGGRQRQERAQAEADVANIGQADVAEQEQ
jgi:hypothetical protein